LADCYRGGAEYGPIPYHPAVPFKMLLLSYLYQISERQTEEWVNDSLAARYFLRLSAHQLAPDHSTLTVFKQRVIEKEGPAAFEERLQRIVRRAKEKGISFGHIQVVDATHSIADVDVKKDNERKDRGSKPRDEFGRQQFTAKEKVGVGFVKVLQALERRWSFGGLENFLPGDVRAKPGASFDDFGDATGVVE